MANVVVVLGQAHDDPWVSRHAFVRVRARQAKALLERFELDEFFDANQIVAVLGLPSEQRRLDGAFVLAEVAINDVTFSMSARVGVTLGSVAASEWLMRKTERGRGEPVYMHSA